MASRKQRQSGFPYSNHPGQGELFLPGNSVYYCSQTLLMRIEAVGWSLKFWTFFEPGVVTME
jgi:hypothetical protein